MNLVLREMKEYSLHRPFASGLGAWAGLADRMKVARNFNFQCTIAACSAGLNRSGILIISDVPKLQKYDDGNFWHTAEYFRTYDFSMSSKVGATWNHMDSQLMEGWNPGCKEKLATSWRNSSTSFYKLWSPAGRPRWRQRASTLAV
jgi:hypothetical protein